MAFHHRESGNVTVIDLNGTLDIYTATDLKTLIDALSSNGKVNFIINMDKLSYIDSSGIGMLIKLMNQTKEKKGKFFLTKMKPPLEKVFKVAGLSSYFQFIGEKEFAEQYPN
ncbi:MAG: STAS domain-containing protein [Leptospiraceae bacterium]|nr:STAS domain-containing protein [Leptospiraceae bacterium]MCP5512354.1 STAS domain-containing protein [Leptospiraceae bacterium]